MKRREQKLRRRIFGELLSRYPEKEWSTKNFYFYRGTRNIIDIRLILEDGIQYKLFSVDLADGEFRYTAVDQIIRLTKIDILRLIVNDINEKA